MKARGGALHIGVEEHEVTAAFAALHPELKPGRHVHLRVADTGAGILPEDLPRIFEPFFTTRSDHEGSGLGLTIVHDIVKSSSGAIAVESDPGRGSTFHVYLPVVEGEAMNEEPLSGPPAEGRERILLIDDEEALIRMGRQMLQSLGYQVLPLSSGVEALERFRADPFSFDLVITDQTMPGITGDDLSRELLRIRPDIPIILCSGYTDRITEVEARRAGIRRFVRKPTPLREFARLIREALDAPWPLPGNGNTSSAASP
jgi:CheY-like chemotaxis protein